MNAKKSWIDAYNFGKKHEDEGSTNNFYNNLFSGNYDDAPEYLVSGNYSDTAALFLEAGLNGKDMPVYVFAKRLGKCPRDIYGNICCSRNYRDDYCEAGVSTIGIYDGKKLLEKNDGTFTIFNDGRDAYKIGGWLHFKTGYDGENIIVGVYFEERM